MLNSSINEQLAGVADIKEGDVVLEIGPGTGSLTNVLVNAGATVLAIEKVRSGLPYISHLDLDILSNRFYALDNWVQFCSVDRCTLIPN